MNTAPSGFLAVDLFHGNPWGLLVIPLGTAVVIAVLGLVDYLLNRPQPEIWAIKTPDGVRPYDGTFPDDGPWDMVLVTENQLGRHWGAAQ